MRDHFKQFKKYFFKHVLDRQIGLSIGFMIYSLIFYLIFNLIFGFVKATFLEIIIFFQIASVIVGIAIIIHDIFQFLFLCHKLKKSTISFIVFSNEVFIDFESNLTKVDFKYQDVWFRIVQPNNKGPFNDYKLSAFYMFPHSFVNEELENNLTFCDTNGNYVFNNHMLCFESNDLSLFKIDDLLNKIVFIIKQNHFISFPPYLWDAVFSVLPKSYMGRFHEVIQEKLNTHKLEDLYNDNLRKYIE